MGTRHRYQPWHKSVSKPVCRLGRKLARLLPARLLPRQQNTKLPPSRQARHEPWGRGRGSDYIFIMWECGLGKVISRIHTPGHSQTAVQQPSGPANCEVAGRSRVQKGPLRAAREAASGRTEDCGTATGHAALRRILAIRDGAGANPATGMDRRCNCVMTKYAADVGCLWRG